MVAGDSEQGEALKILARSHQAMVWTCCRQANAIRSLLREFYPAALVAFEDLTSPDALAVLGVAPTPTLGRAMSRSRLVATLRRGGRKRRVEERASEVQAALRSEQLAAPPLVEAAMGASVRSLVAVLST